MNIDEFMNIVAKLKNSTLLTTKEGNEIVCTWYTPSGNEIEKTVFSIDAPLEEFARELEKNVHWINMEVKLHIDLAIRSTTKAEALAQAQSISTTFDPFSNKQFFDLLSTECQVIAVKKAE